jgi:RNA recognition motif-containing protein
VESSNLSLYKATFTETNGGSGELRPHGALRRRIGEFIVNNIRVENLSPSTTEQDVRTLFDQHGGVRRSKLMTDRWTGLSRGFGFVQMKTDAAAQAAIAAINGTDLKGKIVKVKEARLQLRRLPAVATNSKPKA